MQIQQFVYKCHKIQIMFSIVNPSVCNYSFWDCSDPQMEASQPSKFIVSVLRTCRYTLNLQVKHDIAVKYIGLFGSHCANYYGTCDLICPSSVAAAGCWRWLTFLHMHILYHVGTRQGSWQHCNILTPSDLMQLYLRVPSFSARGDLSVFYMTSPLYIIDR